MAVTDTFDRDTDRFVQWLVARGVQISPKVAVHDFRSANQGRGVIALADINPDEVLFSIPRGAVLSVDADTAREFVAKVPEVEQLDGWMALIVYMMYHAGQGEASPFAPYFNVLPTDFSTLMFWDAKEAEELLAGSTLVSKIGKQEAEESFHKTLGPVFEAHPEVFASIDTSVDAFHRVGSLIMAYSFDVGRYSPDTNMEEDAEDAEDANTSHMSVDVNEENNADEEEEPADDDHDHDTTHETIEVGDDFDLDSDSDPDDDEFPVKAMVPLADTLNAHSKLHNAHLVHEGACLVMRATAPIPQGAQVYNTYGDFPNGDLLRRYGYVETGGTDADIVEVPVADIVAAFEAVAAQGTSSAKPQPLKEGAVMELINQLAEWEHDILEIVDDAYELPVSGAPPSELLVLAAFLTLAVFRPREYKALKRTIKAPSATEATVRPVLKRLLKTLAKHAAQGTLLADTRVVLDSLCHARLARYHSNVAAEATAAVETQSDAENTRVVLSREGMAAQVLAGEVAILERTRAWLAAAPIVPTDSVDLVQKDAPSAGAKKTDRKMKKRAKW